VPKLITAIKELCTMELSTDYLKSWMTVCLARSRWSLLAMGTLESAE
jgi:hypothetical protein